MKLWTFEAAEADALARHSDCEYALSTTGMRADFVLTVVVKLWRNLDCYLNDDPPKYEVEGYVWDSPRNQGIFGSDALAQS